tara:strand:- start:458 stop:1039 length:582 start_codon:yes stop_codon:yes gene_type:complete
MISEIDTIKILRETDALMKGHFVLSSGLHSAEYLQCSKLTMYPEKLEILCKALVEKIEKKINNIDIVASPAIGGIIVGYEVSRLLKKQNVFVERVNQIFELRRNFDVRKKKVLIVEDVITTGKSSLECAACLIDEGAEVIGYSSIIDRSEGKSLIKDSIISLIKFEIPCYDPDNIPDELKKIKPIKPGSRNIT